MTDKNNGVLVHREWYESKVRPFMDKPLVKILSGIRRSGKSSVLRLVADSILESGVATDRVIFLNMESMEHDLYKDIDVLRQHVRRRRAEQGQRLYLFIDEIQEIPGWERAVNSFLADDDADIYISGSNSRLLSGELATPLSGRCVEFTIFPLSFGEFLEFRGVSAAAEGAFLDFLRFGGFPGIHRLEFSEATIHQYLSSLADSVLLKDVVMRNKVRDVALLHSLLLFIAGNIGNIFSTRSVADCLKKERRSLGVETIYNYLSWLESAFVIHKVPRFDIKGKRLLETHGKYYLADLGLRHTLLGYREKDIGVFLENVVYIELRKRAYLVRIGKLDDLEVDFIATRGDERIYIQVAHLLADEATREREFRPLRLIPDNHPKYVLSMDRTPPGDDAGIFRMYLPDFLAAQGHQDHAF